MQGSISTQRVRLKEVTASPKPTYATATYIIGVMVFTRFCFGALAYYKGMSLTEDLCRWDCGWYIQLAENGYDLQPHDNFKKDAANWAFFPLFPLLLAISHHLLAIPYRIAGFLIANIAMFFAIRLSLNYLHRTRTKVAGPFWVWFCISGPYSFYLANGYSEALFWLLGCAALLLWERKQHLKAGGLTALLCATRLFGLFWLLAYLADLWQRRKDVSLRERLEDPSLVLALCLSPLGLILFIYYLYFHLGDGLAFSHVQIAWDRSISSSITQWQLSFREWNDFEYLFSELPKSRYSHAYFNLFILLGLILTLYTLLQKRILESTIALLSFFVAVLAGVMSLPRFLVGTPIFAFAVHDIVARYIPEKAQAALVGCFFLFNLWLLNNWYDVAFFLV